MPDFISKARIPEQPESYIYRYFGFFLNDQRCL